MAERGRPSKYQPAFCEQVVDHMREGASLTSFAAEIGVCRDTITEWCSVHDEFSAAVKRGKAACAAWWEKTNRNLAVSGQGNATACVFGLKNMAADDWRDKHELEHSGPGGSALEISVNFKTGQIGTETGQGSAKGITFIQDSQKPSDAL
jgi:hypothetical protein